MNIKIILFVFILLLIPISCFADTVYGTVGRQTTLTADIFSGSTFYSASSARINIYAPNISLLINNASMTSFGTGRFYYNYTPNVTGEYYVFVTYYNSSGIIATASSQLEVQTPNLYTGDSNMGIVTILAIGFVLAALVYLSFKMDAKYMPLKLLLLLIAMALVVLAAFSAMESKICYPTYSGNSVTLSCQSDGSVSATYLFYATLILYSCFFLYIGFQLVFQMLGYFVKIGGAR